mmetsp:Transcript_34507/g.48058  ORF Transcript_34507/g.48058 Transcript_34507/m.48058 type:complete len:240 (+) Transcript_34507:124-843(+)
MNRHNRPMIFSLLLPAVCTNQIKAFLGFRQRAAELETKMCAELQEALNGVDHPADMVNFTKGLEDQFHDLKMAVYQSSPQHYIVKGTGANSMGGGKGGGDNSATAVVIYPFQPIQNGNLKLELGERIQLIDSAKEEDQWWIGRDERGTKGVFPAKFVRKCADIPDREAPVMILAVGEVTKDFEGDGESQLRLKIGEKVNVTASGEGWYVGNKLDCEEFGIFPSDVVKLSQVKATYSAKR